MRKALIATFAAAAAIVSGGMLGGRVEAMTPAAPSALGIAAAHAGLVQRAKTVCGTHGCVAVQMSAPHKRQRRPYHR